MPERGIAYPCMRLSIRKEFNARHQSDTLGGGAARGAHLHRGLPRLPRPHGIGDGLLLDHRDRLHRRGGGVDVPRHRRRVGGQGGPQRQCARRRRFRGFSLPAGGPGAGEHRPSRGDDELFAHGRGTAPLRRSGRRRGLPLLAIRGGRRQARLRLLRTTRSQGRVHADDRRARSLDRPVELAIPRAGRHTRGRVHLAVHAHRAHIDLSRVDHRRTLRERRGRRLPFGGRPRDPAGHLGAQVAHRIRRRRRDLRGDEAGLRVLRGQLRLPLPLPQIRSGLLPRVQRGRDGASRQRDAGRVLHLPHEAHGRHGRPPGHHDPPRAGAHVVRRPRDDEVVGRPVAQRILRRVHEPPGRGEEHAVDGSLGDLPGLGEVGGDSTGPPALHPPGGRGHPRHRGRAGQLRPDHLRQGRLGAQAARGVGRPGGVPRRGALLRRQARLGQRHAGRPSGRTGGHVGPRPLALDEGVAPGGRRQRPLPRDRREGRRRRVLRDPPGVRRPRLPAPPPHRGGRFRRDRREADPYLLRRAGHRRRTHGSARTRGRQAAGHPSRQRRGFGVREDSPGREVPGRRGRAPRRVRGSARPDERALRRLGHVPRRSHERHRLHPDRPEGPPR